VAAARRKYAEITAAVKNLKLLAATLVLNRNLASTANSNRQSRIKSLKMQLKSKSKRRTRVTSTTRTG
jgi:hypothetical protein